MDKIIKTDNDGWTPLLDLDLEFFGSKKKSPTNNTSKSHSTDLSNKRNKELRAALKQGSRYGGYEATRR